MDMEKLCKEFDEAVKMIGQKLLDNSNFCFVNYGTNHVKWSSQVPAIKKQLETVKGNLYALYIENMDNEKELVYIGTSKNISKRLQQHLVKCPKSTNSQLCKVKLYVNNHSGNCQVYYKVMEVPNKLRTSIEDELITMMKKRDLRSGTRE